MIIRGCKNIDKVIEVIEDSGIMGEWNEVEQEKFQVRCTDTNVKHDQDERADKKNLCLFWFFGSWLPHVFGDMSENEMKGKFEECREDFKEIERAYKRYFGLSEDLTL